MQLTLPTLAAAALLPFVLGTPAPVPNPDMQDIQKRGLFARITMCPNWAWLCNGNPCVDWFDDNEQRKTFKCPDKQGAGPNQDGWYDWYPEYNDVNGGGYLYKSYDETNAPLAYCWGGRGGESVIECYKLGEPM